NRGISWSEQMSAGNLEGASQVVSKLPVMSRMVGDLKENRAIADRYYGEMGELARHRDIINERLSQGMSLSEAKADRPAEYVGGLEPRVYKRSGRTEDGRRYRRGQPMQDRAGRVQVTEAESSVADVAKQSAKDVKAIGK